MHSICAHYLRGSCRFGDRCRNSHELNNPTRNHGEITRPTPVTGVESSSVPVPPSVSLTNNAQITRPRRPPIVRLDDEDTHSATVPVVDFSSVQINSSRSSRTRPRRPPFIQIPRLDVEKTLPDPINRIELTPTQINLTSSPASSEPRTRPRRPPFAPFVPRSDDEETASYITMDFSTFRMRSPINSSLRTRPRRPPFPGLTELRSQNDTGSQHLSNSIDTNSGERIPDILLAETGNSLDEDNMQSAFHRKLGDENSENNEFTYKKQFDEIIKNVESELRCNICFNIFTKPTVLNCTHMFCFRCIETWTNNVNRCPLCRKPVTNKTYCLPLDIFLKKIIPCVPNETSARHE